MRAVVFTAHGGPDVLQVVDDHPEPRPDPDEVVVAVEACALNHLDVFVRRGMPGVTTALPHIGGGDIAGRVSALGDDVVGWGVGDRVLVDPTIVLPDGRHGALGEHVSGGLRERLTVPAANLVRLPRGVDPPAAAALPIAFGTAHRMLFTRGRVKSGETVVVLGAAGGVGSACVQLAAAAGAEVIAVASTDEKLAFVSRLGAAQTVRARGAEFAEQVWQLTHRRGADVVVDFTGQATWPASIRATRHGGRLLTCGATTGFLAETDLRYVWTREQTIIGSDGWRRADLEHLLGQVADGSLAPCVDSIIGLPGVRAAHDRLEERTVMGKIIVDPRQP